MSPWYKISVIPISETRDVAFKILMRLIILPQAIRMMLPEFGNYLIQILKATSLVSLIGMTDILYHGDMLRSSNLALAPTVYLLVLVFYFILALPLIWLTRKAEAISKKGVASQ